eukprot:3436695-Amphidinium_carterae.1
MALVRSIFFSATCAPFTLLVTHRCTEPSLWKPVKKDAKMSPDQNDAVTLCGASGMHTRLSVHACFNGGLGKAVKVEPRHRIDDDARGQVECIQRNHDNVIGHEQLTKH